MTTAIQSIDASTSAVSVGGVESFRFTAGGIKGTPVQSVYTEYTTNATLVTVIPLDDTIPQSTEGTQIISAQITPKSIVNRVRIRFQGQFALDITNNAVAALFVGSEVNARRAVTNSAVGGYGENLVLEYEYVPGVTTTITFTIRVGPASGNLRMNGTAAGRLLGGAASATLVIEEIAA